MVGILLLCCWLQIEGFYEPDRGVSASIMCGCKLRFWWSVNRKKIMVATKNLKDTLVF